MPATPSEPKRLLFVGQAAEIAGCKKRFMDGEIAKGRIPVVRLSRKIVRIRTQDLDAYIARFVFIGPRDKARKVEAAR